MQEQWKWFYTAMLFHWTLTLMIDMREFRTPFPEYLKYTKTEVFFSYATFKSPPLSF